MKVAFGPSPLGPYTNISKAFTDTFTEGPTVLRLNNEWIIYYDVYRKKTYEAVKTSDFKSFTNINDQIFVPEGHKHGTIFITNEKILEGLLNEAKAKAEKIEK